MPNLAHLKVLLKKDIITLLRNRGFLIAFILLPTALMCAFWQIQLLVDNGTKSGALLNDYFRYTSTTYVDIPETSYRVPVPYDFEHLPKFTIPPVDLEKNPPQVYYADMAKCGSKDRVGNYYSKVGIVAKDDTLRANLVDFFQYYVLNNTNLNPKHLDGRSFKAEGFATQDELFEIVRSQDDQPYCFAVNFKTFDTAANNYEVEFSFNRDLVPDTNLNDFNVLIRTPDFKSWNQWFDSGAVGLYPYITEFIARAKSSTPDYKSQTPLYQQFLGYAPMKSDEFIDLSTIGLQQLTMNFPFFFMIIYLIPFYYLTSKIASEKESKAREGMKMMGLTDSTYYLAWFIHFFLICFMVSIIIVVIARLAIFKQVNPLLLFLFCMMYSLTLFGWAFVIVAFLPTSRTSGIAATLFHVISFYLSFILQDPNSSGALQYSMSVFPNICMNQIIKQIFFYNFNTAQGLNFSSGHTNYQNYSFNGGILLLLGDVVFWTLLGLYLDQVIPSDYGVSKPWNFLCKRGRQNILPGVNSDRVRLLDDDEQGKKNPRNFEPIPDSLKRQESTNECLKIRGLVKRFGNNVAVKGTSMTMYSGQIFALLGHNGAGKTTTLSMLTGLIPADEGAAEVFGIDIFNNMDEMRKQLGVCPQHDVLFDFLTPEDHLRLFASFKGTDPAKIEAQVQEMLEDIDLATVKGQISKNLSGGQKRKLSVAIAMIGDSKIVMLDEPTSGMDTTSRRKLWEMLKKNKSGRIVILTTHYMDEADILGDRIAIMAEGDVQCTGSSLFLKNRYGVGYNLIIAKQKRQLAPQIDEFIQTRIHGAKKVQEVSSEISYQLPTASQGQFKAFFTEFDQSLAQLGIRSYGVGITTLEEVFLKIGHGEELEAEKFERQAAAATALQAGDPSNADDKDLDEYSISNGPQANNFLLHTYVLMKKKLLMQIRDKKTLGIDAIFPVILIFAGLALATVAVIKEGRAREMTPFIFPIPIPAVTNDKSEFLTAEQVASFADFCWIGLEDSTKFTKVGQALITDFTQPFLTNLATLDDYVYDQASKSSIGSSYGQVYVHSLGKDLTPGTGGSVYRLALLLNSTSQSAAGAFGAYANTAILKEYLKDQKSIDPAAPITLKFTDQPFPLTKKFQAVIKAAAGTTSAILMSIAWMMISDSLVQNIIKERQKNIKHQIMISGSSVSAYWMGNYLADIIFQAIPAGMGIVGVHVFGLEVPKVEYLFLVTVFANPAFIYFFSFLFESVEAGSLTIKILFFLLGIIAPIAISILQVVNETTQKVGNILRWFCYPFPAFSLSFGYISIANRDIISFVQHSTDILPPYDIKVSGPALLFLLVGIPFYWALVVGFEKKLFDRGSYRARGEEAQNMGRTTSVAEREMDEDVREEQLRVEGMSAEQLPVRVNKIRKTFGNVVAVDRASFGLEFGECFALLGVSGAGKSTCFKCLTGEIYPSLGDITIGGADVTTAAGFELARKQIGYCPQFDAIFEGLTVLEHLQTYACLKGIQEDLRARMVDKQIKDMDLESYRNIRANNLSGGNKRKLSVAMAMIGNPPLVFLDEPSTGVDPQAKRFMWNIVSRISTLRKKSAVIITTHSMEEAEALCTKMGIMVNGEFKCFGSSQYIKDKYGTGFELEVKIRTLTEKEVEEILTGALTGNKLDMNACKKILLSQNNSFLVAQLSEDGLGQEFYEQIQKGTPINAGEFVRWQFAEAYGDKACNFLENKFKSFEVIEHYGNSYKIKVSRDDYSIGFLFGMMEDIQKKYNISEYSVTQTTLEQIFNNFAIMAEIQEGRGKKGRKSNRKSIKSKVSPYRAGEQNSTPIRIVEGGPNTFDDIKITKQN